MENPFAALQHFRPQANSNQLMQSYQQGQQTKREEDTRNALSRYATNPEDPEAFNEIARVKPELAIQLRQQREEQRAQQLKVIGRAAEMADTPEKWDQIVVQLEAEGIAGASQYKGKFSPALRSAIMAKAGIDPAKQSAGPSSVQEFEYAKQSGFQGSYMEFMEEKRGPMIASNGDGTFTIVPRSMAGGQQPPPPPPGFVIDGQGGQAPQAPGGFPFGPQ